MKIDMKIVNFWGENVNFQENMTGKLTICGVIPEAKLPLNCLSIALIKLDPNYLSIAS